MRTMSDIPKERLFANVQVDGNFRKSFDNWLFDTFGKVDIEPTKVNNPNCNDCYFYARIGHRSICQSIKGDNLMQCNPHTMRLNNKYWCPEGYVCN